MSDANPDATSQSTDAALPKGLAVILARGGSKGVPGKNIAPLAGKPCLQWTIEQARSARCIDEIVVSTDSSAIAAIAQENGVLIHHRSAALASDTTRVDDALRDAVGWFDQWQATHHPGTPGASIVVMLYGNVPIRPDDLIDRAFDRLIETGCDSVQSYVNTGKYHPLWQVQLDDDASVRPWQGTRLFGGIYRRQELPEALVPDGGVVVLRRDALFLTHLPDARTPTPHSFLGRDHRGVVTQPGQVVDIDSPIDLVVARTLLEHQHAAIA